MMLQVAKRIANIRFDMKRMRKIYMALRSKKEIRDQENAEG